MRAPAIRRPDRQTVHPLAGLALAVAVVVAALSAIAGGLLRAGVAVPGTSGFEWPGAAVLDHAALMVGCFMGTVIGIERAVALRHRLAWVAPSASATAGIALLAGHRLAGGVLLVLAAAAFAAANVAVVRRQRAAHTALLLGSALAWLAGNTLYAAGAPAAAVLPWWFALLVGTIAAERLEMTRLMRRRPGAQASLGLVLGLLVGGAALSAADAALGGLVYGMALVLLAAWLFAFDIARRTVAADGLPRYMAVCLLGGYAWLGMAGLAWAGTAAGLPLRDAALHALGLGFVLSMMMGHAPVILPAVAGVKVAWTPAFYLPLALLHASLLLRLGPGALDAGWRATGALLNAVAIAGFAATVLGAALAWRRGHPQPGRPSRGARRQPG